MQVWVSFPLQDLDEKILPMFRGLHKMASITKTTTVINIKAITAHITSQRGARFATWNKRIITCDKQTSQKEFWNSMEESIFQNIWFTNEFYQHTIEGVSNE